MNTVNHLLSALAEEGAEISQASMKIHRFGIDDVYTHISEDGMTETIDHTMGTNRFRLVSELNDLIAVVEMLVDEGAIPEDWESDDLKTRKKKKVQRYMDYARRAGTLVEGS